MLIGIGYQYFLSTNMVFLNYLIDSNGPRITLVDNNKEGLFSLFGYMCIYFAGESICYQIKHALNEMY
jgi:phosphatidylinositol glycan class W